MRNKNLCSDKWLIFWVQNDGRGYTRTDIQPFSHKIQLQYKETFWFYNNCIQRYIYIFIYWRCITFLQIKSHMYIIGAKANLRFAFKISRHRSSRSALTPLAVPKVHYGLERLWTLIATTSSPRFISHREHFGDDAKLPLCPTVASRSVCFSDRFYEYSSIIKRCSQSIKSKARSLFLYEAFPHLVCYTCLAKYL